MIDDLPLPVQLARARDTIKEQGIENADLRRENARLRDAIRALPQTEAR